MQKYLSLAILVVLIIITSCTKEAKEKTGSYRINNDSDFDVNIVNYKLPRSNESISDTLFIESLNNLESSYSDKAGIISDPWNVFYADTVFIIFNDTTKMAFYENGESANNIRKDDSWIVKDEGNRTTSFTYTITNEDYERAN